ncbi:MAG: hypothetical protein HQM14_13845 [SAR324 cluster bacterium]|nr:hypothetical protein [SAR324 cluster bacterium]
MLIPLLIILQGCDSILKNYYHDCKSDIEYYRKAIRKIGHYSYRYDDYTECIRPFHLQRDIEEWQPP